MTEQATLEVQPASPALAAVPILVVDDNPDKRLALKAVLSPLGYSIVEAESGVEALRCVMKQSFAVILLDVRMPDMDGFETAGLIRERRESEMTPIIFITAFASDEIAPTARYVEGAVDFIFSPVLPDELRAKVSVFANLFMKAEVLASQARDVQRSVDRLRLLTDAAPIGIFQTDADGRYIYSNPRWSEIIGIPAVQARGQDWPSMLQREGLEKLVRPLSPRPSDAAEICERFEISHPGEAKRTVLVTSQPIPDSDGGQGGWVGTVADVTAEADAEIAMAHARDEADEASLLKSDFLANMSHEIRTPMNGVIGMVDLLLESDLDDRQKKYAQTVRDSGEAMLDIISDILDFSKVEAGKLEIESIEFELRDTFDDVVGLLERSCKVKDLTLQTDIHESVPVTVVSDPGRLRQILINLIGNAIKFTDSGQIVVTASRVNDSASTPLLRFEVTDSGVGIAPGNLGTIFQPFMQADTSTSRKYGGTGLGLAISGRLIALMGGDCGVASDLGVGSTFWFTIKVGTPTSATDDAQDEGVRGAEMKTVISANGSLIDPPERQGPALILLVEDDEINQKVATAMLEKLGYQVDVVADGRQAVDAALRTPYRAVLMDCHMPVLDGYEATEELRRRQGSADRTPVIALTAGAMQSDRERCIGAGMDDYISKPLRLAALDDLLLKWVQPGSVHSVEPDQLDKGPLPSPPSVDGPRQPLFDPVIVNRLETLDGATDQNLMSEVAEMFVSDADSRLGELDRAFEAGDSEATSVAAHTLGGASANLGATELASLCSALEKNGPATDATGRESMLDAIKSEMVRVVSGLDALIETP